MFYSRLALLSMAVALTSASAFAAGPEPGINVTVTNPPTKPVPVTVQGGVSGNVTVTNKLLSVDVLNDLLNEPYVIDHSSAVAFNEFLPQLQFDIPDGKRLIVESMTARVALNGAGTPNVQGAALVAFSSGIGSNGFDLSLLAQGTVENTNWFVGTHPIKMRIDAIPGRTDEITMFLRKPAGVAGTWNIFVSGYLVPLPN